jgi:hypothetical protein
MRLARPHIGLKVVVISTKDETGKARRARMNFRATVFDAKTPADVSERMRRISGHYKFSYTTPEEKATGLRRRSLRMANFESHLAVLRMIVARDLRHVVVCEDDAVQVRPLRPPPALTVASRCWEAGWQVWVRGGSSGRVGWIAVRP